jgi:transposase-like protein
MENTPKTLQEAMVHFSDYENCYRFMVDLRWADGKVTCPQCDSEKVVYLEKAKVWKCYGKHAKAKFSLKTGTIFEDSPIGLEKWIPAVWMLVNCKNGVSSYEIHRALGVTQKTAWFMLHRIRLAVQSGSFVKLGGKGKIVEVDETFIGGAGYNMHVSKKKRINAATHKRGRGMYGKTVVQGILERGGKVHARVLGRMNAELVKENVRKHVEPKTTVMTDAAPAYRHIDKDGFKHEFVDHAVEYVDGRVHTNGIENFWSLLKRGIGGTYVAVEPFHLFRYVDEQVYRFNTRKEFNDSGRFEFAMDQIVGKRLTYSELTGKEGLSEAF